MKFDAYVTFKSPEDAQLAISKLDGLEVKKTVLKVALAQADEKKNREPQATSDRPFAPKTARESVTKLADMPYNEQLSQKTRTSSKLCERLLSEMRKASVHDVGQLASSKLLRKIKPSPKITAYRNKCEFTIGCTHDGKLCVGFVCGRFAQNEHHVISIADVDNITEMTKKIVEAVTDFVEKSGLPPFDEFARKGVWKMLTVREFGGDVMLIITVNPLKDQTEEEELKRKFCSRFLNYSTFVSDGFRVTSIYWHSIANCSDQVDYEHIGGAPYIYESLLGCRFRVSPSAFFQTNSLAAEVLYTTIGESCGLISSSSSCNDSSECAEVDAKRIKLDGVGGESVAAAADGDGSSLTKEAVGNGADKQSTVLLDICCGTGTIGQSILKEFRKKNKVFCIGIDIIEAAVKDARENAKSNGIKEDMCRYIAGKAEDIFPSLRFNVPSGFDLQHSTIVGVLDPPRCGVHDKVVLGCRTMETLRRLVFVSCDPAAAMKNLVDLCRPTSKKYAGRAFKVVSIQPIDMFPQTPHIEWVVVLER